MRTLSFGFVALLFAAASPVRADTQYVVQCVDAAVEQAKAAGDYSGYGAAGNSFCVLGGWLSTGETLSYKMNLEGGKGYLFVGGGDKDVADLDLQVHDGEDAVEDTDDDNTPWVHVKAESDCEVTINLLNFKGSGEADFCAFIILEEGGADGSTKALTGAVRGLCKELDKVQTHGIEKTAGAISFMGGLFGTGGELGIHRNFAPGEYALVGYGDSNAEDVDLTLHEGDTLVAEDSDDDATPVVQCKVGEEARGTVRLKMFKSKGNAWGMCAVLEKN